MTPALPRTVTIPGGSFEIGCRDDDRFANDLERPRRLVSIRSFVLGIHPVSEGEWAAFRGTDPPGTASLPVVQVSWEDAVAYCAWLGQAFRLPSESEWEYACRAGSPSIFPSGHALTLEEANYYYDENGNRVGPGHRLPLGWGQPNAFGLHDMLGNVSEWVADDWVPHHADLPGDGTPRLTGSALKTIRGGAWDYLPRLLRCSSRDFAPASTRRDNLGFRIAHDLA